MIDPLYSLSGFAVGALVGMTGVGGVSLMTPLLILLFGVHPATAVGTDLLYAAATKTGGSLVHGFARSIDWRVVRRLATGSVPATIVTLAVLSHFNLSGDAARNLITLVLSVALFATAFVLVFGGAIVAAYRACVVELNSQRTAVNTVLVGMALGVLVSISSVGAGAIGSIALIMLYPQLPMARIVGSLPGIFVGSYFAIRIPERALRLVLATTLFVVASRIAYDHATAASSVFTAFSGRAVP